MRKDPKTRELAEALGISAHALLERCRAAGMAAQNTITRLTRAQETIVRSWFLDTPASPVATDGGDEE